MLESLLLLLQTHIIPLGAGGVFLASVMEEVVAPIPSALVMMSAGFLFVTGPVDMSNIFRLIFMVALPAAGGVTLGSLFIYGIAWWGGKPLLVKWGKWVGLYWDDMEKLEKRFIESKKDEIVIMGARVIPIVPSVAISALCGFFRMNIFKYIWLTFFGMFIRGLILATVGWQIGNVYYRYADIISHFESAILILIISFIAILLMFKVFNQTKSQNKL